MTNNPTMTPGDAVAEVQTLLDSAQSAIGGHWESRESGAEDCALPDGTTGARFALGATGPGLPAAELTTAVASVTSAWSDAGFAPVVKELAPVNGVTATQVSYPESGEGVDGLYLRLRITESGSALDAQTRCVPGDSAQING